jgi:hypothetical protein
MKSLKEDMGGPLWLDVYKHIFKIWNESQKKKEESEKDFTKVIASEENEYVSHILEENICKALTWATTAI